MYNNCVERILWYRLLFRDVPFLGDKLNQSVMFVTMQMPRPWNRKRAVINWWLLRNEIAVLYDHEPMTVVIQRSSVAYTVKLLVAVATDQSFGLRHNATQWMQIYNARNGRHRRQIARINDTSECAAVTVVHTVGCSVRISPSLSFLLHLVIQLRLNSEYLLLSVHCAQRKKTSTYIFLYYLPD